MLPILKTGWWKAVGSHMSWQWKQDMRAIIKMASQSTYIFCIWWEHLWGHGTIVFSWCPGPSWAARWIACRWTFRHAIHLTVHDRRNVLTAHWHRSIRPRIHWKVLLQRRHWNRSLMDWYKYHDRQHKNFTCSDIWECLFNSVALNRSTFIALTKTKSSWILHWNTKLQSWLNCPLNGANCIVNYALKRFLKYIEIINLMSGQLFMLVDLSVFHTHVWISCI